MFNSQRDLSSSFCEDAPGIGSGMTGMTVPSRKSSSPLQLPPKSIFSDLLCQNISGEIIIIIMPFYLSPQ